MSDWTSGINHAKKEKSQEIARNLIKRNRPIDENIDDTGLTRAEVESLR
jgi:hypothetical protein